MAVELQIVGIGVVLSRHSWLVSLYQAHAQRQSPRIITKEEVNICGLEVDVAERL